MAHPTPRRERTCPHVPSGCPGVLRPRPASPRPSWSPPASGSATGTASAGTLSGTLYRDPNSAVVSWVAANPNDSRMPGIRDKIASQPAARWFGQLQHVHRPGRGSALRRRRQRGRPGAGDCRCTRSPTATAAEPAPAARPTSTSTRPGSRNFARGLGNQLVIIILETDSIALQTCLNSTDLAARNQALSTAVQTIKSANPNAKVYLDGGHSAWNSAADQANRLRAAGSPVRRRLLHQRVQLQLHRERGQLRPTRSSPPSTVPGVSGKRQIIDTSRNGGASGDWCGDDNTDRRIGQYPTLNTGDANIDGYLWVKPPGEADGCAFTAGSFQPSLANSLANGVAQPAQLHPPPRPAAHRRPQPPRAGPRPPPDHHDDRRPPLNHHHEPPADRRRLLRDLPGRQLVERRLPGDPSPSPPAARPSTAGRSAGP